MAPSNELILSALGFSTWAVYMGGLAAVQDKCSSVLIGSDAPLNSELNGFWPCSKVYGYYWFIMSFELVLIVALAAAAAMGKLKKFRGSFLGLFSVATLLYMQASQTFTPIRDAPSSDHLWDHGQGNHRARTVTAGAIMTAVVNGLLVIVLGMEEAGAAYEAPAAAEEKKTAETA